MAGARLWLTTPTGDAATTASLPTGDLLAAWRASNADSVISATSAIPSGPAVRTVFPALSLVLRSSALRRIAVSGLAPIPIRERPTEFTWGHVRAEWHEVARRLLGQAAPGAYTPAALFGASLATDVGADLII